MTRALTRKELAQPILVMGASSAIALLLAYAIASKGPVVAVAPVVLCLAAAAAGQIFVRPYVGLFLLVGCLTTFPVLRISAGALPFYASDALLLLLTVAIAARARSIGRYGTALLVYVALWVPAWLVQVIELDLFNEPTYGFARNAVAVLAFLGPWAFARTKRHVETALTVLATGTALTALITLFQAFPPTEGPTNDLLTRLSPAFVPTALAVYPDRAFALFTAPTTLSGFLAIAMVVLLPLIAHRTPTVRWPAILAVALSLPALLATYSRQWLPALLIGLIVLGLLRPPRVGRVVVALAVAGGLGWIALSGGGLDASYLQERFQSFGSQDVNFRTRVERQREFFDVAREEPRTIIIGRGFAAQDLIQRDLVDVGTQDRLKAGFNDNVFLLEALNHGLAAAALYAVLLALALWYGLVASRRSGPTKSVVAGLTAGLATAIALHFFDNYFSEAVFMKALLWLLIGLLFAAARLNWPEKLEADRVDA